MKGFLCWMVWLGSAAGLWAQSAPAHLQVFGMAVVDCYWDDPNDSSSVNTYLDEVDSFSNVAQLCVFDYRDDVVARVQAMQAHCMRPLLSLQAVFFEYVDTQAPSGANYDLFPDFVARWDTFRTLNASVLTPALIGAFYLSDEPLWNGMTAADMDTVTRLVKADFPGIPTCYVEAWPVVEQVQVPVDLDWIGFDRYAIFDPENDPAYQAHLDTLKALRSGSHQKILLVADTQWHPYHGSLGLGPDTVAAMVQNYYDLAVADSSVIGLIGYLWPGGLDGPGHLGLRNLSAATRSAVADLGMQIKANDDPCQVLGSEGEQPTGIRVWPHPARGICRVDPGVGGAVGMVLLDVQGRLVWQGQVQGPQVVDWSALPEGVYWLQLTGAHRTGRRVVLR